MSPSLMSPGAVDWRMNTALVSGGPGEVVKGHGEKGREHTVFISHTLTNRNTGLLVRVVEAHGLCEFNAESVSHELS